MEGREGNGDQMHRKGLDRGLRCDRRRRGHDRALGGQRIGRAATGGEPSATILEDDLCVPVGTGFRWEHKGNRRPLKRLRAQASLRRFGSMRGGAGIVRTQTAAKPPQMPGSRGSGPWALWGRPQHMD